MSVQPWVEPLSGELMILPDSGGSGGDEPFIYEQPNPSAMWHIVHGRGSRPSVVIERDDGTVISGFGVSYPDLNTVDIYPGLIAGVATLNF